MEKENWNIKFLREQEWKSNGESDSDWTINGQANRVFTCKTGLKYFDAEVSMAYMRLLGIVFDPKVKPNIVNQRVLFKTTLNMLSDIFCCSRNAVLSLWGKMIESGLIEVKKKSSTKGVPSEYYLVCPATLVLNKVGVKKVIKKEEKQEVIDMEDVW